MRWFEGITLVLIITTLVFFFFYEAYTNGKIDGINSCGTSIAKAIDSVAKDTGNLYKSYIYHAVWNCSGKEAETQNNIYYMQEALKENCTLVAVW